MHSSPMIRPPTPRMAMVAALSGSPFCSWKIGDIAWPVLVLYPREHGEREIRDGRARRAARVVAVDDLHHRVLHILEAVQHDLISAAQIVRKAFHQRNTGAEDAVVLVCEGHIVFRHGAPS